MTIHVLGTNSVNKGAELMLAAIAAERGAHLRGHEVAVPLGGPYTPSLRTRRELQVLSTIPPGMPQLTAIDRVLRAPLHGAIRLASYRSVGAILDASGFRYGDQWGPERTERRLRELRRWREKGCRIVLLPQALGPFRTPRVRAAFLGMLSVADLVYARDATSWAHAMELGGDRHNVRRAPDFTIPVHGAAAAADPRSMGRVAIVPNQRMVDRTGAGIGERYVAFLQSAAEWVVAAGLEPVFVIHETAADRPLVDRINRRAAAPFAVVEEPSPLRLKSLLGGARFVIGSRFHALVSALAQGVPCVATTWSHKYQGLFEDFGIPEFVLADPGDWANVVALLKRLGEGAERQRVADTLRQRGTALTLQVNAMWEEIAQLLQPSRVAA